MVRSAAKPRVSNHGHNCGVSRRPNPLSLAVARSGGAIRFAIAPYDPTDLPDGPGRVRFVLETASLRLIEG